MNNIILIIVSALLTGAACSCNTAAKTQANATFNYDFLYNKVWVVDTIIVLGKEVVSTPNMETDKNKYRFAKAGANSNRGTRTTILSEGGFDVPYTIKDGTLHFDPSATFPLLKFDENGNLISSNMYADLPPYKIIELTTNTLSLNNNDILMKLKAEPLINH